MGPAGTVYRLSLNGGGGWTESVIYSFASSAPKANPNGLAIDAAGNLYGTAQGGGSSHNGFVYELRPGTGGIWTFKELHSFGPSPDGASPVAEVILDSSGNVYGTTARGGSLSARDGI
jgi:hypothetical protein